MPVSHLFLRGFSTSKRAENTISKQQQLHHCPFHTHCVCLCDGVRRSTLSVWLFVSCGRLPSHSPSHPREQSPYAAPDHTLPSCFTDRSCQVMVHVGPGTPLCGIKSTAKRTKQTSKTPLSLTATGAARKCCFQAHYLPQFLEYFSRMSVRPDTVLVTLYGSSHPPLLYVGGCGVKGVCSLVIV